MTLFDETKQFGLSLAAASSNGFPDAVAGNRHRGVLHAGKHGGFGAAILDLAPSASYRAARHTVRDGKNRGLVNPQNNARLSNIPSHDSLLTQTALAQGKTETSYMDSVIFERHGRRPNVRTATQGSFRGRSASLRSRNSPVAAFGRVIAA